MKFSIVVTTYQHLEDCLRPCLNSLVQHTDLSDAEIVVVANGSDNDTREFVESLGPQFKLVWFDEPIGYTRAANEGIKASSGDYVVLLNNDCVILGPHWLPLLYQPFQDEELTAVTGPLMLTCPEAVGREFLVFFCVMIAREAFDSLGLLDEIFNPGYGEDADFCLRAVNHGWQIKQVPGGEARLVDKGCEDLPQWKRDKMWTADFPLYHDGNKTFGSDPRYEGLITRNSAILKERYGNVNTPVGTCPKHSTLILDGVCVCCESENGLNLWRASVIDGWFGVDEGRWLASQVAALPANAKILEVGSWHGRSSRFIADNLPENGQVWCVDTFNGSSGEPEMHGTAHWDRGDHAFQWWWCNLQEHILAGRVVPVRMHSENAAHTIGHLIGKGEMEKFDLIFLDGDHSEEGIKTDVEAWLPLLKEGGLICGHDYYKENEGPFWVHVRQYVEAKFPGVEKSATSIWHVRPETQRTVIDCIPFNDELLLLQTRFAELDSVVDRFVITEAPLTHSGNPKPLHFAENKELFAPWLHKVTHIIVDDFDHLKHLTGPDRHWAIERHQRDSLMRGLTGCKDDDIIIISDTDEIPKAEAVANYRAEQGLCCLEMRLFYGYMNNEAYEPWRWTRLLPYGLLKQNSPCWARYVPNYEESQLIKDGGWHFSFMGGPDAWAQKLEDSPHQEYNRPELKDRELMQRRALAGQDILGREARYRFVPVDESYPEFITNNLQQFKDANFTCEAAMHSESRDFIARVKAEHPDFFVGKKVLEVGSLDVNGSVRQFFEGCDYTGIDLAEGNGVDFVSKAHEYVCPETHDVVISSEMLEHDKFWTESLKRMYDNLKPGGLLILSCAGPQRPEHGTTRTDTFSSPFTTDYYRNISQEDFLGVLDPKLFSECVIGYERGEEDLNFWGIKQPAPEPAKWSAAPQGELAKSKHWTVTAEVSTKDRYFTTLPLTISAIATQAYKPNKLMIYDDGEQLDLRTIVPFDGLLRMLDDLKIEWEVVRTPREGQVSNHQHCLDNAKTDFIWRVDDDEIPMPDCLERLINALLSHGRGGEFENIGAVAGLVHHPGNVTPPPEFLDGSLKDVQAGMNLQWFAWNGGSREVEHLYSTFLYRAEAGRKAGGYPKGLSVIGHREETIFSHSIKRAGYKLLIEPSARTFHLRAPEGGIRSFTDHSLWEKDEQVFQSYLHEWGANGAKPTKLICLDCGIGDHFAFKSILPRLKEIHADKELVLAVCYPNVFEGENLRLISIADAQNMLGERYGDSNLYKQLWDRNWKGQISEGMLEVWG